MFSVKILTFILAIAVTGSEESATNPWEKDYRIPKNIHPVSYNLLLDPNLGAGNFKGEITALVNVTQARDWIPIHIKNLDISKTVVTDEAGKPVKVVNAFKYLPNQFWVIQTDLLQPGLFNVYLKFNGSLIENISGFYKSVYYENGTSRAYEVFRFLKTMTNKSPRGFSPTHAILMALTVGSNILTTASAGEQQQQLRNSKCLQRLSGYEYSRNMSETDEISPRIPPSIAPIKYNLLLNPNLESGLFEGNVVITVNVSNNAPYIPVHVKDLEVTNTSLTHTDENETPVPVSPWLCEKNQFWVLSCSQEAGIVPGVYKITLDFKGKLTGKIVGFYRSLYTDVGSNELRSIATTKFEPVDARQAFPCFDEPALKATFVIRIVRPKNTYSALSNMNVVKEEPGPGPNQVTVHFAETVPMSTYLVCFIVSDFKDSGSVMVNNKGKPFPVKIYSTPGQVENTLFAKSCAGAVSNFYIDYFGIPYPLPKLDLIAIPDFVSGAMENWGLITFRETALLFNEKENSAANRQRVATVVSHEISHMWFGNLVTMNWWDDLWLNEGFASFMQYKGVDEGMPDCKTWQMLDQAIHDQIHPVLKKDSVITSHPIIQPVSNPNQITEIFDSISYNKGHAVIKMLEGFMGAENFKKGIQNYLKAHLYSTAATPDLWVQLDKVVNSPDVNVGNIMDTWTRQMGYPVVKVEKTQDAWVLTQSRFLADGNATFNSTESPYRYKWDIPIHYVTDDSRPSLTWLKRNEDSVKITRKSNFIKLNHKQLGFYRVNYDPETWKVFENLLKTNHKGLDYKDRANLLDDVFALAGAGKVDYGLALDLTGYLKNEREFLPWATGASALSEISNLLTSSIHYTAFRKYVRTLVQDLYGKGENRFSFDVNPGDSHPQRQLRVKILSLACKSGLQSCLFEAGTKFLDWIKKPEGTVHPDVRSLVYYYGMGAVGKEHEWDVVWSRYLKENNPQEKINLLECLAAIKEPWILSRYVELAKNESYVRSQDYFPVLGYISSNPVGNPIVWKFFRNEWPYLVNRFSLYHRVMGTFIATVTNGFASEVELEEMEAFYKKYPDAGAGANARKTALEKVKNNMNWLKTNEPLIGKWLAKINVV